MDIKYLNDEFPDAIFCMNMQNRYWIQMENAKYYQVEWDENTCLFRVWLWGEWYHIRE